jgi:hypothetical protein
MTMSRLRAAMGAFACAVVAVTLLQLAGPVFAQSASAAAPSGSLDLTNLVQSAGSVIVSAVSVVAYFFLNKYVKDANARTVLLGAIENGVKWGVAKTAGALPGHALSVNVGSQAAAAALQHVIDSVPDALARHGNDFAGIVRIALGKLPIDGQIDDATVNQIVANATGNAPATADIGKQLLEAAPAFAEEITRILANRGKPAAPAAQHA